MATTVAMGLVVHQPPQFVGALGPVLRRGAERFMQRCGLLLGYASSPAMENGEAGRDGMARQHASAGSSVVL
ncbi:hypothetical protein B0H13DRAFT_2357653 [Mycena leptocephala]|nr:hypothetical protein B0H13DRAFT_2357653 [Mycena leptocephala]